MVCFSAVQRFEKELHLSQNKYIPSGYVPLKLRAHRHTNKFLIPESNNNCRRFEGGAK